jgi:hypothetical protein
MPPFALRRSDQQKEEKVRPQFTRPAKFLFNSADLGSKAFSYVSAIPNSFLSFSFLVLGFYPINRVRLSFYIRLSIIHRALFVHLRLLPPFDCLVVRDPPVLLTVFDKGWRAF